MASLIIFDSIYALTGDLAHDDDVIRIAAIMRQLQIAELDAKVATLTDDPTLFLEHGKVFERLGELGDEAYPISVLDGEIVKSGAYPTNQEIEQWLDTVLLPLDLEKELAIQRTLAAERREKNCAGCDAGCAGGSCSPLEVEMMEDQYF